MKTNINLTYMFSTHTKEDFINDNKPEFLLSGKSNVGKSSLINALGNNKNLAKISSKPGKTRSLNFFDTNKGFRIVDAPGYGYAKVSARQKVLFADMMDDFFNSGRNIVAAIQLLDSRHEPKKEDLEILQFYKEVGIEVIVVLTKTDKLNQSALHKAKKNIEKLGEYNVFFTSSVKKKGLEELILALETKAIKV